MKISNTIILSILLPVCTNIAFAQDSTKTGPVYAVWDIHLKEDADHQAFEAFYLNQVIPLEEKCMPGLEVLLVKGDRGEDKGAYKYIWMFNSVSDRDVYYPEEGGGVKKGLGAAASEMCRDEFDALTDTYMTFYDLETYQALTSPPYTDLVVIKPAN